jgi:hypothetical protein
VYAKKHKNTGDWLLQTKEFQAWFSSSNSSLLWCLGKCEYNPRLYIMIVILLTELQIKCAEDITANYALDENIAICFAYYNYQTPLDHSQIVAALIKQLCRRKHTISPWLLKFKRDSLNSCIASTPESFIMLTEELNLKGVYAVIDALDECPQ